MIRMELVKTPSIHLQPSTPTKPGTSDWVNELHRVNSLGQLAQLLQGHQVKLISVKLPPRKRQPWDRPR